MPRLENYILQRGLNEATVIVAHGEVYDDERFEDGNSISTSRIVEYTDSYVKTKSGTIYHLGKPHEIMSYKSKNKLYLLRRGADAIHKLGNIKRDALDAELITVHSEDSDFYIGNFVEGYGFADVKFKKSDCRKPTTEELDMCDNGNMRNIKF